MAKVKGSSAQRNKEAILRIFNEYELSTGRLLEIGSGSGDSRCEIPLPTNSFSV
jgi:hypothetical protein